MGQLIMRWKNDGKPDAGFSLPENCTVTTFSRLENAMDHWLDLMQYGLTEGKRDGAFYREVMTARPNYREDRCFFVLERGTPVATMAVLCDNEKKEGYVHMVACRTEARGKGYGTLLNRIVCRELKNAGMEYVAFLRVRRATETNSPISDDLFYEVQEMLDKMKKAPARAKADESYILSTKLFCGYCKAAITGISGTSKTGKKHHYYQCVTNRRDKSCSKKTVRKAYIENLVVTETRRLLTKTNIDKISREVVRLCEQEQNTDTVRSIRKAIKANEKAIENLFRALESGQITDVITERIMQKQQERKELEHQLLAETASRPKPTLNEVRFFLSQFKTGDINDVKYRQALVDAFVDRIYLYDDKMTVLYNAQGGHFHVAFDEKSSSKVVVVEAGGVEPPSENPSMGTSPGADGYLHSLVRA